MERRATPSSMRRRRRLITLLWISVSAILVITLLYYQQAAVLYVLATLSVAGLLIVVALSDLGIARQIAPGIAPRDDAAAIADGAVASSTPFSVNTPQAKKRR